MNKKTCVYDRERKAIANHYCEECGVPLCSFCGYIDPPVKIENKRIVIPENVKHLCNKCFKKYEKDNK